MDIGKKRLVRVGGEQIQLSACWMDGCLIDADGSLPLQDELNAGKGRNRGITFPRLVTDDEVGALQTDGRFAQAVLNNQICFVHRLSVLLQWLSTISRIVLCIAHLQPAGNYNHYSIIQKGDFANGTQDQRSLHCTSFSHRRWLHRPAGTGYLQPGEQHPPGSRADFGGPGKRNQSERFEMEL